MNNIYQHKALQERQDTSQVLTASGIANSDVSSPKEGAKCHVACRCENTGDGDRSYVDNHTVFVLDVEGNPLTPTTPAKARKLLRGGVAKKVWSKFNTFGVQMLVEVGKDTPKTTLGYDPGTKYEGLSVVCGKENSLSVMWMLPDKKQVVRKMGERSILRRARRNRNCRRRKIRFQNRSRKGFIAPSQNMVICSRLKALKELIRIYPVSVVGMEDVRFDHFKKKWGRNFSTVEVGKSKIRQFFKDNNIEIQEFRGFETAEIRKKYGYKKTRAKDGQKFSSHCSDSLSLAVEVNGKEKINEGKFLVVDDTYRFYRRKLHVTTPVKGGIRKGFARGSIKGIGKGVVVGTKMGNVGQLCGIYNNKYRYYDINRIRRETKEVFWIKNQFKILKKEEN